MHCILFAPHFNYPGGLEARIEIVLGLNPKPHEHTIEHSSHWPMPTKLARQHNKCKVNICLPVFSDMCTHIMNYVLGLVIKIL